MTSANPDPEPTPDPTSDPTPEPSPSWQTDHLDVDLRGDPTLARFKNVNELGRSYLEARSKLGGEGALIKPGEDASDEQRAEFFNALGRPVEAKDYDMSGLSVPEGMKYGEQPEFESKILDGFHKLGISQDQAKGAIELYLRETDGLLAPGRDEHVARMQEWDKEIHTRWGSAFNEKYDLADRAIKAALGDELAAKVANIPMPGGGVFGANPQILDMFAEIGGLRAEAGLLGDKRPTRYSKTPEQAIAEIEKLRNDPEFRQKFQASDSEATRQWQDLHKQAYPED